MDRGAFLLIDVALKGSVLLAVAWIATILTRRRSAALRHGIWTAAVLAHLLLPALALTLPAWRVSIPMAPAWIGGPAGSGATRPPTPSERTGAGATPDAIGTGTASVPTSERASTDAASATAPATGSVSTRGRTPGLPGAVASSVLPITARRPHPALIVWLAGCAAVLLSLLAGTIGVWRLTRRSARVHDGSWLGLTQRLADQLGISRPLTLRQGADLGVPVTFGVVYPVVLLPPDADAWDGDQRREVLVHEMAHVRRLDALTQLLAQVVSAVYWFSPLVWVGVARMRREREHACDDFVLREGSRASRYADDLLTMVRALGTPSHRRAGPAFAALAMARRSEFEGRMLAILEPHHDRRPLHPGGTFMLAFTAVSLTMTLAAFKPQGAVAPFAAPPSVPATTAANPPATPPVTSIAPMPEARTVSSIGTNTTDTTVTADRTKAAAVAIPIGRRCDTFGGRRTVTTTSSHISVNDDDVTARFVELEITRPDRCLEATLRGAVEVSPDERRIVAMPFDGLVILRERRDGMDRRARITGDTRGAPNLVFTVNDQEGDDRAGEAWVARILPEVLREAGVNVPARVKRMRASDGLEGVLSMIDDLGSSSSKRAHYRALLDAQDLSDDDVERATRHASRSLSASPGDLRAVLERVPVRARRAARVRDALDDGIGTISSDGDRRSLLTQYVVSGDRDMLLTGLRGVRVVDSDGDKRSVLLTAAAAALNPDDPELRDAFFDGWKTLQSDGDRAAVLMAAAPYGHAAPDVTHAILRGVRAIQSDGDAARVLMTVAGQRLVTTPKLRSEYLEAARALRSSGDQARAISALIATTAGDTSSNEPLAR